MRDETWLDAFEHELEAAGVSVQDRISARVETQGFIEEAGTSALEHFGPPGPYAADLVEALGGRRPRGEHGGDGARRAIEVTGLSKSHGGRMVLHDVSFAVGQGDVAVLIGPNGAGKSTLLRILAGLDRADAGEVAVTGAIGYVPQQGGIDPYLTPAEHFGLFGAPAGLSADQAIGEGVRLARELGWDAGSAPLAGRLSGGTAQKLATITAVLSQPDTLLLDEPCQGMDADSQQRFWALLWRWQEDGRSAVVSSHATDALRKASQVIEIDGLSNR